MKVLREFDKKREPPDDWYELLERAVDQGVEFKMAFMQLYEASAKIRQKIKAEHEDWDLDYPAEWAWFLETMNDVEPIWLREIVFF